MQTEAILALADGSVFRGYAIGATGETRGELVFNTAMTGYQEILTDPSYSQQLVTLTYPHIGNTGVNALDFESNRIHAAGLIIRDLPSRYSSWRGEKALDLWLKEHGVVAIAGIDTREITRRLRSRGAQNACIIAGAQLDEAQALERAKTCPAMNGQDLAHGIGTDCARVLPPVGTWRLFENAYCAGGAEQFHVVAYDFGIKSNICRILNDCGARLTLVPADTSAEDALALKPDGIFLSNGPGDPAALGEVVATIRVFLERRIPLFGICLGHQLLALAAGAQTVKMKHGHHGANHPVQNLETGQVLITAQNHGFAVDEATLPDYVVPTHRSLFDGTLQGLRFTNTPAWGFQGHPESSPGPHEARALFQAFISALRA